jgi:tetratricopeptide (TPR) repeat protein
MPNCRFFIPSRLIATLLTGCLAAVVALPALAQTAQLSPDEERNRQEALEIFNQGKMSYKAGDYSAAQQLFLRAWAKYDKEPLIALALGKAYDRDANYEKAIIYYKAFLRLAPADKEFAKDRETTVKRVEEVERILSSRPGILKFKGLPTGAKLLVDGKPADPDTQGELKVDAGTHKVVVTMDERMPFERAAVAVGPGEIKEIEVVLMAPIDPRTLPRDHTWTWVAGSAAAASLMTAAVFGVLALQENDDYYTRFDSDGTAKATTLADYKQADGVTACKLGDPPGSCPAVDKEGQDRIDAFKSRRNAAYIGLGAGATLAFATAVLYWVAPVKQTPPQQPQTTWRLAPLFGSDLGTGAVLTLQF